MRKRKDFSPEFKREAVRLLDAGRRIHQSLDYETPLEYDEMSLN